LKLSARQLIQRIIIIIININVIIINIIIDFNILHIKFFLQNIDTIKNTTIIFNFIDIYELVNFDQIFCTPFFYLL